MMNYKEALEAERALERKKEALEELNSQGYDVVLMDRNGMYLSPRHASEDGTENNNCSGYGRNQNGNGKCRHYDG